MVLKPFGLHHVAIQVHDLPRAARFYEQVLRLPRDEERRDAEGNVRAVWLVCGPSRIVLEQVAASEGPAATSAFHTDALGLHVVALQIDIDDRDAWRGHLKKNAVPVVHETVYSLFVRDPEGNRIGITHYPDAVA